MGMAAVCWGPRVCRRSSWRSVSVLLMTLPVPRYRMSNTTYTISRSPNCSGGRCLSFVGMSYHVGEQF